MCTVKRSKAGGNEGEGDDSSAWRGRITLRSGGLSRELVNTTRGRLPGKGTQALDLDQIREQTEVKECTWKRDERSLAEW